MICFLAVLRNSGLQRIVKRFQVYSLESQDESPKRAKSKLFRKPLDERWERHQVGCEQKCPRLWSRTWHRSKRC
jgi:hypothetical protein